MTTNLSYNKSNVFGPNNIAPENLGAIKRILRIKTGAIFEHHACVNECQCFPFLHKSKWKLHLDDKCSICGMHRFHLLKVTAKDSVPSPRRKFYVFGISSAIKRWYIVSYEGGVWIGQVFVRTCIPKWYRKTTHIANRMLCIDGKVTMNFLQERVRAVTIH